MGLGARVLGADHLSLAPALDALASVETRRGRRGKAIAAWEGSIRIPERATLATHPGLIRARAALAALRTGRG
ncbi:MAG TPA: hypothetical protein VMR21_14535 [Vicinamibacteria bacterium]|nr:hypothetical protein [Vicinamibacteria bacterium]